ncbi:MAG: hypothetical protein Q8O89_08385, partial [Nanoarchaeota archaeon]|nr:hypothetical protein [Nanoarchaeota archaeon]
STVLRELVLSSEMKLMSALNALIKNNMIKNGKEIEDINYDLKYIGSLITEGFTSGYYPCWRLYLNDVHYDDLSETTLKHISKSVADGYIQGEVIENYLTRIYVGWWRLQT